MARVGGGRSGVGPLRGTPQWRTGRHDERRAPAGSPGRSVSRADRRARARSGRRKRAREIFESMLAHRNHPGLLSEDTHPVSGEMWGNFPRTCSMVGIINGAVRLSAPWDTVI